MYTKEAVLTLPITLVKPIPAVLVTGLSILSLAIPFYLGHPQWLVGIIVNACLFSAAIFLPKKYIWPIIILPSLGVLSRGLVFGPLTMFLVYFLPFIWLGNFVLVSTFKKLYSQVHYLVAVSLAAVAKFFFLWLVANIYFQFALVPSIFVKLMGFNQLATALAGGVVTWLIFGAYKKYNAK
jgi:hypothetical protein